MFVQVSQLPAAIQKALAAVDYNRRDILVDGAETGHTGFISGDGFRAFTAVVNLGTQEFKVIQGSWGGSNAFTSNVTDEDQSFSLENNVCVINGRSGGNQPVMASVTMHPSNIKALLPTNDVQLSECEQVILAAYKRLNSNGRKDLFARKSISDARKTEALQYLASKGLVTVNKAGNATITTEGKNVASNLPSNLTW